MRDWKIKDERDKDMGTFAMQVRHNVADLQEFESEFWTFLNVIVLQLLINQLCMWFACYPGCLLDDSTMEANERRWYPHYSLGFMCLRAWRDTPSAEECKKRKSPKFLAGNCSLQLGVQPWEDCTSYYLSGDLLLAEEFICSQYALLADWSLMQRFERHLINLSSDKFLKLSLLKEPEILITAAGTFYYSKKWGHTTVHTACLMLQSMS